jgi:outer membrane murein-binding lipoprotein Lpp
VVQAKGMNENQVSSSNKTLETRIDELTSLVKQLMLPIPQPPPYNPPQVTTSSPSKPSLEELVKQMAVNNLQFQQRTDSSIQTLQTQIGQLANSMNVMQKAQGSNQLPAQTVVNPKVPNVSAISLRSGKVAEPAPGKNKKIVRATSELSVVVEVEKKDVSPIPFPQGVLKNKKIDEEEHSVFQIELFSEVVDEAYSDLFSVDFLSFSGFDDIYSCDDCTNTNLCAVCAEIDVAL